MSDNELPDLFSWWAARPAVETITSVPHIPPAATAVPVLRDVTATETAEILVTQPSLSAPQTTPTETPLTGWEDWVSQYLDDLSNQYWIDGDIANVDKIAAIEIYREYIMIAGIKIKRENEKMNDATRKNAWARYNTAVFWFASASNYFWDNLPTEEEWTKIINALPGNNDAEKRKHAEQILGIVYTDIEHTANEPLEAYFWIQSYSQPQNTSKARKKIGRRAIISKAPHSELLSFKNSGDIHSVFHSVRLIIR